MLKFITFFLLMGLAANAFGQTQTDRAAIASSFIDAMVKKDFDTAYGYFDDAVKPNLSVSALAQTWGAVLGQLGAFKSKGKVVRTPIANGEKIATVCEFEKSQVAVSLTFNQNNKIVGFFFDSAQSVGVNVPKYETPAYADLKAFTEKEVTVGAGEWAVPGTLTMPVGKTNVPAIVLVHGSGPNDRDETFPNTSNKVFKDLAEGLATKGIAVLRYDKRTLVHGAKLVSLKTFTINDETVDDALLAVDLLRKTSGVDAQRIYVLGHSLGGLMLPRIGQRDAKIAGLIYFAAPSRPLTDIYIEQNVYLASLNGKPSAEAEAQIDALKKQVEITKNVKADTPADTKLLFGVPVSYWLDLNAYNPTAVASEINQPMLILQGESDYQVTMDNFQLWKKTLGNRKNVVFKSYPMLTHTFMESANAKSAPSDYEKPNHVNEKVIGDIANWILR